jgi:2-polyprenyl-3-methyl-5-hydroxy-6-metoxy-1,4-benzoquinol methylase
MRLPCRVVPGESEIELLWADAARSLSHQGVEYLGDHLDRFWATYRAVAPHVRPGTRILSVGGGSAYVEAALARVAGAEVTIVDFPEAVADYAGHYDRMGLRGVGAELTGQAVPGLQAGSFDILLSSEVIEHVPESPRSQLARLVPLGRGGGRLFVTTPNLPSLRNILKLALNRPIAHHADFAFGPVTIENEWVHRREYTPTEIEEAMRSVGVQPLRRTYCWYRRTTVPLALRPLEAAVPRLRDCMIIEGRVPEATASLAAAGGGATR